MSPSRIEKVLLSMVMPVFLLNSSAGQADTGESGVAAGNLARLAEARDLYQENCAACHGYDGVPMVEGAANFSIGERLDKGDAELLAIIKQGKNNMPPWEDILSEQERMEALMYVRVLAGDQVYQKRCASCHAASVPRLPQPVAEGAESPGSKGSLEICRGSDVEADMTRKELLDVIGFLKQLSM